MSINERQIAVNILMDVKRGEAAGSCLQKMTFWEDKRARSFITQLVYGTLENYIYIDFIIDHFSKKPVNKMKPFISAVLEISVYQLLFLDNIPEHAVVNEAVRIVEHSPQRGLKGFVNGVLRSIARAEETIPEPDGDVRHRLSVKYSVPELVVDVIWGSVRQSEGVPHTQAQVPSVLDDKTSLVRDDITDSVWGDRGEMSFRTERSECEESPVGVDNAACNPDRDNRLEDILRGLRQRRPLTIRCNTSLITPEDLRRRLETEGVSVSQRECYPKYAFAISRFDSITGLEAFKEGLFYIQDISSMLSGEVSDFKKGERVLDLCAAPGGKSIGAALAGAIVEGRDRTEEKTALIRENVKRMKLNNITVKTADACVYDDSLAEGFDAVIADVPCSGIGIIGRKPDICLHITAEGMEDLIVLQRKILDNAVKYVKPGGRLIYSTCTINSRENTENGIWAESLGLIPLFEKQWLPSFDGETDGFYTKIFKKADFL